MALTRPFINTIPAFDAQVGTAINLNVLSGDAISGYDFSIYSNDGTLTPIYTSDIFAVTNDVAGASIRTFPITITQTMGNLQNNNSYRIEPRTYSMSQPTGQLGTPAYFQCYTTPTILLQQYAIINNVAGYVDLESGDTVQFSNPKLKIIFDSNDLNSVAQPNIGELTLYGVDDFGNSTLITSNDNLYGFSYDRINLVYYIETELNGFTVNVDSEGNLLDIDSRLFSSFTVQLSLRTVEGMELSIQVTGLNCFYNTLRNSPYLTLNNYCQKGIVEMNCFLTNYEGESNPSPPTYIDEMEIDLTTSGSWVRWQNYFALGQNYTLSLWGRNFNTGVIAQLLSTIYTTDFVRLSYNEENGNAFISLECKKNGQPTYYLESDRIATTSITSTTDLFIGVQQQGELFELSFSVIS